MAIEDIKVSILMPAYNAEEYIGGAIESILNQTFEYFEFIIIDDCSTDGTWGIIKNYAKKDNRIKAFKNERRLGIAGNRNKLVSLAKGKYIAWQDADDISLSRRIGHQFNFMESNLKVGIIGGYLQIFNGKKDLGIRKYALDDRGLRQKIFRYSPVAQPAAMIRKRCLNECGDYDLSLPPAEDLDMSFRIGTKYEFANLQEIVIKYRQSRHSATFKRLKTIELNTLAIRKKYSKYNNYKMTFFDALYNFFQFLSIYILPSKIKIWLFNFIRDN